jgi:hypothetical protein
MAALDSRFHVTATNLPAHLAAFLELPAGDQRRHLRIAHRVRDPEADLELLARTEGRAVTYADAHDWWHHRQRRSLTIGGDLDNDQGWGWR